MKIGIGNDHVAVEMKNEIKAYLEEKGHEVVDFGTNSSERCNYPVYGEAVANAIVNGEVDCGVLICGTGVGISLSANKVNGIRAVSYTHLDVYKRQTISIHITQKIQFAY